MKTICGLFAGLLLIVVALAQPRVKPLTDQEMIDIIAEVKAELKAKTPADKFRDAVRVALQDHMNSGVSIDDPRIDDALKSFTDDPAAIIKATRSDPVSPVRP